MAERQCVTVDEVRDFLRITHHTEDDLLESLIAGASDAVQSLTGRQLIDKTFVEYRDDFSNTMQLPHPPLDSVSTIVYVDTSGTTQTLAPATYDEDTDLEPGEVRLAYGQTWPALRGTPERDVRITYVAGYGGADDVPHGLKTAVKMLAGNWYEHREAASEAKLTEVPMAVKSLVWQFRVPGSDS